MGLISTVELPTLAELGPVHFIAIGGSGMNGIASMMLASGLEVSGSDRQDSKYLQSPGRPGCPGARRPPGRAARGGAYRRRLVGHPGGQSRARRGTPPRAAGAAPQRGARLADARPPRGRRGRHARQDHDHRDDLRTC